MTEFDEMVVNVSQIALDRVHTFNGARALAFALLPKGETETMRDNFAQAIYDRAMRERSRA